MANLSPLRVRTFRAFRQLHKAGRHIFWKASTLLGDTNPKTAKSLAKLGILTKVLHLAPTRKSGFNLCASSTAGCEAACLDSSGHGQFDKTQASRIAKARWLMLERDTFLAKLDREIANGAREASRKGLRFAVRLNATSDVRWEALRLDDGRNLMERHPDVQFYDYTKHANRKGIPSNYHLTFSLADGNEAQALEAHRNGLNVAVVFGDEIPDTFDLGDGPVPVLDGTEHDARFTDAPGHIVGLRAIGDAIGDRDSGFVRWTCSV